VSEPEPDLDYLSEDELIDRDIDPEMVRVECPWATEYRGLDGRRCWVAADLTPLWEGGRP
jgi:hypothetical protein